ncbi:conserved hypothetical protein [Leishmania major strain Friedlin]|uniref:Uncharacterized protein n=1 Tax=Leishmania major TaxID=5664 RepID=E9ACF0_LEIMA|nr:conserved hypothetical protein [Leishmania major strain Friedlin]CAG9567229.1 hypothetical_protein_-_conserved [Leishmania major strain Friedlin]CBZ11966.1 conserved hypothetical protein [Leishmania major strain Friedlin]|eukprot:XP_003721681.1 conserved hypothetical protein [Leishmania major strain Friedlin]
MTTGAADKKHLVPLLEFLRFVSERGRSQRARFPKRINGVTDLKCEPCDSGIEADWLPVKQGFNCEVAYSSSYDSSPSASRENAVSILRTEEWRKRSRSDDEISEVIVGSSAPIDCELDSMTTGKGCVTSKYFDFSLIDLGAVPMIEPAVEVLTKGVAKRMHGKGCCYVLPGTSMVVTGDIVDVSLASETVLVSPDRGLRVGLEWVSIRRVFHVPKNIAAVREEAAFRIQRIIQAERRGERTPRFSPVQLAEIAEDLSSSLSPDSDEDA